MLESTQNSSCENTHEVVAVQSLSRVRLFETPCAARQASLSFTISCRLLKLMSMESVMPSNQEPTLWKRTWCWEKLRAGGEGDGRGWDGWIHTIMTQYYISRNSAPQDCGWPTKLLRFPQEGKHQPQPWEMLRQPLKLDQRLHWSQVFGAQRREMSILPTSPGVGPLATPGSSQFPGSHPTWYLFLFPPKVFGVWT